ncbi:MAG: MarR family transcriptional regulator [Euzebyales bacterium]|nr:MarR family transcriptional regulator [Euzebyales bacterium]
MTEPLVPARPRQRVAPGTHETELRRLALQEATHAGCDPLSVQALIWLFRAYNAAVNAQSEQLRPLGLSPSAFNVLMALHNSEGHVLEPCQLAERLLVSRPSVTGLLHTLQAKQLITRRPHDEDRRRVIVGLTPKGLALLESHFDTHYREQNALFAELDAGERAELVSLLRRVRGAVPADLLEPSARRPS